MDHKSSRKIALGIILVLGLLNAVQSATKELANSYNRKMGLGILRKASNEEHEQIQQADFKNASGILKNNNVDHLKDKNMELETLIFDNLGINPSPTVETQRLLVEATKELVALMDRDYKGMNSPKLKPPIHN